MFDTGITPDGVVENMRRLELSPRDVEAIVLSHGHFDRVGGMVGLARELGPRNLPVVIHPEGWNRRRIALPIALVYAVYVPLNMILFARHPPPNSGGPLFAAVYALVAIGVSGGGALYLLAHRDTLR